MTEPGHCAVCSHELAPTELRTCATCLAGVRQDLAAIPALYATLPAMLGHPVAVGYGTVMGIGTGEPPLPGGDALAMLGPGGEHGEGDPSDPPAVSFELWTWCTDWARIRGETSWPGLVPACVAWLSYRAGWAADHHPAFDGFAADVARILRWLGAVTTASDRPDTGAPCFECGANLERRFTATGRVDDWTCPRCHRQYDDVQYRLAVRADYERETAAG